jgi:hypothetical protein
MEVPVPKSLLPKGGACLQAVSLSTGSAWFVLTTAHEEEKSTIYQTTLVSWASTLRGLLESLESSSVVGLQWMRPTGDAGGWKLTDISEVWVPDAREEAMTGVLLFKESVQESLLDERGAPVGDERGGRRQLAVVQA